MVDSLRSGSVDRKLPRPALVVSVGDFEEVLVSAQGLCGIWVAWG